MKKAGANGVVVAVICIIAASCNIFEPRDAESPSQSGFQYLPFTDPSYVVANLRNAVANADVPGYVRCFADSQINGMTYTFNPSADASTAFPRNWNVADELNFFTNLTAQKKAGGYYNLTLTFGADSTTGSGSKTYPCTYNFTFDHNKASFPANTAVGTLQFILSPDQNGNWTITRWSDSKSGESLTITSFKEQFRQ